MSDKSILMFAFLFGFLFSMVIWINFTPYDQKNEIYNVAYTHAMCERVLHGTISLSRRNERPICSYIHNGQIEIYQYTLGHIDNQIRRHNH